MVWFSHYLGFNTKPEEMRSYLWLNYHKNTYLWQKFIPIALIRSLFKKWQAPFSFASGRESLSWCVNSSAFFITTTHPLVDPGTIILFLRFGHYSFNGFFQFQIDTLLITFLKFSKKNSENSLALFVFLMLPDSNRNTYRMELSR